MGTSGASKATMCHLLDPDTKSQMFSKSQK